MLSIRWWERQGHPGPLAEHDRTVVCADGRPMKIIGKAGAILEIAGERIAGDFLVADISPEGILGADLLKRNGILVETG